MKIPKTLKILAHTYKIEEVKSLIDEGNQTSQLENTILISKDLEQTAKEETLFHEILHAINCQLEEKDVEFLAQTIYAVLKENNLLK